jgi:TPR repeat protein
VLGGVAVLALASVDARADYTDGAVAAAKVGIEAGLQIWRRSAWQEDDFLSQIHLGDIYGDDRGTNKFYDPVEAYVWYYLATKSARIDEYIGDGYSRRIIANNYHRALAREQKLMLLMNAEQREEARNRIIYILSCRGADGFIRLGQIHTADTDNYGPYRDDGGALWNESPYTYGAMSDMAHAIWDFRDHSEREFEYGDSAYARRMMGLSSSSVIVPNDGEALMYFHIADNMGHPLAQEYLRGLDRDVRNARGLGAAIADDAADRARYWSPPFEFYPVGDNNSGVPYSDECAISFDHQKALELVDVGLPPRAVQQALWFLGWSVSPVTPWSGPGAPRDIARYQQTIGHVATGRLTATEAVRLIQTAAIRGDASSQNSLGVMYAKGIGVARNYVRAQYWFQKAADQRYGAALYHLGVLYKVGPDGIHQDLAKANDYFTSSAFAGFKPTMNQLGDLLNRAAAQPPHDGQH